MKEFNKNDKINKLKNWILEKGINKEKLSTIFQMIMLGKRGIRTPENPIQYPNFYIKDDHATAWHHPEKFPWIPLLEKNFEFIKREALNIFQKKLMVIHPENNELAVQGTWNTFFFYKNGTKYIKNHEQCPVTSTLLSKIPGVDIAGRTYFSAMTPGVHIKAHCGPHNFKLRTHLGIITPEKTSIRVGQITKNWQSGKCIVFDDSFEHEVWNNSDSMRIVLIVDVWNPVLSFEEIMALQAIMPEFYNVNAESE